MDMDVAATAALVLRCIKLGAFGFWLFAVFFLFVDRETVVLFNQSQSICRFRSLKSPNCDRLSS